MATLPEDRLTPAPPFTYCGVDFFGPFNVKEGRKVMKRYGVLFACAASRVLHIETANSLTTDSFINALRRFISIRGPIRQLRSDRGTNFVGAERDLRQAIDEMDERRIGQFLSRQDCGHFSFKMNVPHASHMGGIWERQIRSVRTILAAILYKNGQQLDDESLRTYMYEVSAVVNSRPLTVENLNDPLSAPPLTPSQLLTMKSTVVVPPPGNFLRNDLYSRKYWRRVQHLANEFWSRWRAEYLSSLQSRQKWQKPQRSMVVGDIVLVKEENIPRCEWTLAKVVETLESHDGYVRKVRLQIGDRQLDKNGKRVKEYTFLERPIHKLVLLLKAEDQGIPVEEP